MLMFLAIIFKNIFSFKSCKIVWIIKLILFQLKIVAISTSQASMCAIQNIWYVGIFPSCIFLISIYFYIKRPAQTQRADIIYVVYILYTPWSSIPNETYMRWLHNIIQCIRKPIHSIHALFLIVVIYPPLPLLSKPE